MYFVYPHQNVQFFTDACIIYMCTTAIFMYKPTRAVLHGRVLLGLLTPTMVSLDGGSRAEELATYHISNLPRLFGPDVLFTNVIRYPMRKILCVRRTVQKLKLTRYIFLEAVVCGRGIVEPPK